MDSSVDNSYVILTNETKKPRRWAFWLAGIFIAIAIVSLVALIIVMGNKKGGSIKKYTNEYLNLLSTGEKSDADFNGELTLDTVSSSESANIYTIPRYYSALDERNVGYYNELIGILNKIREGANEDLVYLVDDSKTMISYYFAATTLGFTDADYKYYFENGNLDGLLSVYGYPFDVSEDDTTMNFKSTIDDLYESDKTFYESVKGAGCIIDNEVDYGCLEDLDSGQINEIQEKNSWLEYLEETQSNQMLNIIVMNANNIKELVSGGLNE